MKGKGPAQLLYGWFRQGLRTPGVRQWVIAGSLIYLISPIDLIPSFLPGVGEIDDVVLLGLLLSEALQIAFERLMQPAGSMAEATGPPESTHQSDSPASQSVVDIAAVAVADDEE